MFRSLAESIRAHNWFAVVVEFVLVVAGVLMGVLLAAEIERNGRRAAEGDYLAGLGSDYGVYQALLVCRIDGEAAVTDGLNALIAAIDGEDPDAETRTAINISLSYSHSAQSGLEVEGNTSALLSGALVETISDGELRGRILAAQGVSTSTANSMNFIQLTLLSMPRLDAYATRQLVPITDGFGTEVYAVTDFDLDGLRADPTARDTLMNLVNIHASSEFSDRLLLQYVTNVMARLETLGHVDTSEPPETCPY